MPDDGELSERWVCDHGRVVACSIPMRQPQVCDLEMRPQTFGAKS